MVKKEIIALVISSLLAILCAGYLYHGAVDGYNNGSGTDIKHKLSGTYVLDSGMKHSYLTLHPDGTFYASQDDRYGGSFIGDWKIEGGGTLLLIKKNGYVNRCSITNTGTAIIDPDGDVWVKKVVTK